VEYEVTHTGGFMGRFTSTLQNGKDGKKEVNHGVTILATGAEEYRGSEYAYGTSDRILTGLEFEQLLRLDSGELLSSELVQRTWEMLEKSLPEEIVMLLCVGPAEQFCSRICCTTALKNALALKERNPNARIVILYRDIRTYGFKEKLYTEAREKGVIFIRYDSENKPDVQVVDDRMKINVFDPTIGRTITLRPDLLVLSNPAVPPADSRALATMYKVPVDSDGFFMEAHVKLRPVDFSSDGIFMAGMAHYPKFLDETIVQAQAAASRAGRILSKKYLTAGGIIAQVDPELCVGCLTCVRVCPFDVPQISSEYSGVGDIIGAAFIEPTVCQGCGNCVAECPAKAIHLWHYEDDQIMVKLDALLLSEWSV
jgi:heterodisulfide reductase subunit A